MVKDVRNYTFNHSIDSLSPDHAVGDPPLIDLLEQIRETTDRDLGLNPAGSSPPGPSGDAPGVDSPASPGGVSPPAPGEGASPPGSPPSGAAPTGFIQEKVFVEQAPGFVVKDKDGGELVM